MGCGPPSDARRPRSATSRSFSSSSASQSGGSSSRCRCSIRRLTTTTNTEVEISAERIRGAIRWSETFAQRAATGLPHVFVTAPTRRAFDTPENEILAFALHAIAEFGRRTGWHKASTAGPAQLVAARVAEATRWRQARALIDVPATLPRRQRRSPACALVAIESAIKPPSTSSSSTSATSHGSTAPPSARPSSTTRSSRAVTACSSSSNAPSTPSAPLREQGWQAPPDALLRSSLMFHGRRGDSESGSSVRRLLVISRPARGMGRSSALTPFRAPAGSSPTWCFASSRAGMTRWILIEVKGGPKRGVRDSARAATHDLLAYRRAFGPALAERPEPYGLGYAWGAGLTPSADAEIVLCTPEYADASTRTLAL